MDLITTPAHAAPHHRGVLVPTMGALHAGHAALIRLARQHARHHLGPSARVVVTVFVNPTQFNVASDYARYPRVLDADADLCRDAGADALFTPSVDDVYPGGPDRWLRGVVLPTVATAPSLEDAHRPGHMLGVYVVVKRLFELTNPAAAVFGEKDWQQLQLVRELVRREHIPTDIIPAPTVREPDGLAMSSRNRFLSPEDRLKALSLSRALTAAQQTTNPDDAEHAMRRILQDAGVRPDYAVIREASTLVGRTDLGAGLRAVIAGRLGEGPAEVRLLDNAPWPRPALTTPTQTDTPTS